MQEQQPVFQRTFVICHCPGSRKLGSANYLYLGRNFGCPAIGPELASILMELENDFTGADNESALASFGTASSFIVVPCISFYG